MAAPTGNDRTSGLLPESVAAEVMSAVEEERGVMGVAKVRRTPARTDYLPLTAAVPSAQWIAGFPAETEAQGLLAAAIARELDRAIPFGGGPAGFPPDAIVGTSPVTD